MGTLCVKRVAHISSSSEAWHNLKPDMSFVIDQQYDLVISIPMSSNCFRKMAVGRWGEEVPQSYDVNEGIHESSDKEHLDFLYMFGMMNL